MLAFFAVFIRPVVVVIPLQIVAVFMANISEIPYIAIIGVPGACPARVRVVQGVAIGLVIGPNGRSGSYRPAGFIVGNRVHQIAAAFRREEIAGIARHRDQVANRAVLFGITKFVSRSQDSIDLSCAKVDHCFECCSGFTVGAAFRRQFGVIGGVLAFCVGQIFTVRGKRVAII